MEKYISYTRHNSTKDYMLFFLYIRSLCDEFYMVTLLFIVKKTEMTVFEYFDRRDLFIFL